MVGQFDWRGFHFPDRTRCMCPIGPRAAEPAGGATGGGPRSHDEGVREATPTHPIEILAEVDILPDALVQRPYVASEEDAQSR